MDILLHNLQKGEKVMNKFLCFLLAVLPFILCSENYIVENEKHQTLLFISTAKPKDKTADFLSMTFPESNLRIRPRGNVISPAELSSLKGDKKVTVTLGPAVSGTDFSALLGDISNVKHITIFRGEDLSFLKNQRVTSLTLVGFNGKNIDALHGMPIEKLILNQPMFLDDKIIPCLKSLPLKHLEIYSGRFTDYSFLKELKLHTLKIRADKSFRMECLPEEGLEVFHLTAAPDVKFTGREKQLKRLKELVLSNVFIDAAVLPLLPHSDIENLALQQVYVNKVNDLFDAVSRLSRLKNFFCLNILDDHGHPHDLPWNKLTALNLQSLVCDSDAVPFLSKFSTLHYLKIACMRRDHDRLPDEKALSQLCKLKLTMLVLCRFPKYFIKFPFPVTVTDNFWLRNISMGWD